MRDTFDPQRIARDRKERQQRKRKVWDAMPESAREDITELIREFHGPEGPQRIHLKVGDLEYKK